MYKFVKFKLTSRSLENVYQNSLVRQLDSSKKIYTLKFSNFSKDNRVIDITHKEKIEKSLLSLNFPKTSFSERLSSYENETKNLTRLTQEFYIEQLKEKNKKLWVTHENPSTPDGAPHLGLIYNRVMKDSLNRLKIMQGYKVHYNLGFECYGVGIEERVISMKNVYYF